MKKFFNINGAELKVASKQVKDDNARMDNVGGALQNLSDAISSDEDLAANDYKLAKDVIRAALPHASDKQFKEKLNFYKKQ